MILFILFIFIYLFFMIIIILVFHNLWKTSCSFNKYTYICRGKQTQQKSIQIIISICVALFILDPVTSVLLLLFGIETTQHTHTPRSWSVYRIFVSVPPQKIYANQFRLL